MVISRASWLRHLPSTLHLRGRKRKHYVKANKANQNEPPTSYVWSENTYVLCQYLHHRQASGIDCSLGSMGIRFSGGYPAARHSNTNNCTLKMNSRSIKIQNSLHLPISLDRLHNLSQLVPYFGCRTPYGQIFCHPNPSSLTSSPSMPEKLPQPAWWWRSDSLWLQCFWVK